MSTSPDSIESAWLKLSHSIADSSFPVATVKLPLDSGYGPVRLAMGNDRAPQLLIPTTAGRRLPEGLSGRAVNVTTVQYVVDGRKQNFIEIRSTQQDLESAFHRLVDEILRRLAVGVSPELAVSRAISDLRDLLRMRAPYAVEFLVGLFGELLLLIDLLERNPDATTIWIAPFRNRQDFAGLTICAEVKATLVRSSNVVTISSLDQLLVPADGRKLILAVFTLERAGAGGKSVFDLLQQAYKLVGSSHALDSILKDTEIRDWRDDPELLGERFSVIRRHVYRVDEGFPRLTSGTFVTGRLPPGISSVVYKLDLSFAESFQVGEAEASALLDDLASVR